MSTLLQRLLTEAKNRGVFIKVNIEQGEAIQKKTLNKLIQKAQGTAFGRRYNFKELIDSDTLLSDYQESTAMGDYIHMLPWWTRARLGEDNVCWSEPIKNYAVSSGTSDGSSKYIPVSDQMLKYIRRASMRQVLSIIQTDVPKDHIAKKWLMIGGSTELEYNGTYYSGDLSGITTGSVPILFQRLSKPGIHIRKEKNWREKIAKITEEARDWDVGLVAGVPAWIKLLMESIIDRYDLDNIHDIWPHFEAYIHGGVALSPYKKSLDGLMGRPIKYFETYLASEGFIAYQTRLDNEGGMRLLIRNGIYYEFVPFTRENFTENGELNPGAKSLTLSQVNDKDEYALLISTCSGAWRYLIGDTIRFTNLDRCEIKITGRTKHFLSLCGEHLSVDNMTKALELVANDYDVSFEEFTVCGIPYKGFFAHEWYISCDDDQLMEKGNEIRDKLDMTLKVLNDDYRVERSAALKAVKVHLLPTLKFYEWMSLNGKEGSQNKFPRVLKKEMLDNWKAFLGTTNS
ncbi:MAG: GH3 auxin-responsive promoter [Bacteroidetes bacterium]|nr:MAG: GH3 auxin-responsive promoter [Bacteroidota bacterium]